MISLRTGFIGLGQQGGPMAERMNAAGCSLQVWARRPEALEPFVANGAVAAESPADLAAQCDYVAVCVVDDAGVSEICEQLIPAMAKGSLLVIHSTILPETCDALARECAVHEIGFLDAPVSGGGGAAAAGQLAVMCGGELADFARAKPIMEAFADKIVHLGAAGAGQRAKIINNAMMAANMGVARAALEIAKVLEVDRESFVDLVKQCSGRSYGLDVYARLPEPWAFGHGAPLLDKDVNLLSAVLPHNSESELLRRTARHFLDAALQPQIAMEPIR